MCRVRSKGTTMKRLWMVLGDRAFHAELLASEPRDVKNVYQLSDNEYFLSAGYVDPTTHNIVAAAIVDGSREYPTRYNRIETGDHLDPFGPRGGMRGVRGVVIRESAEDEHLKYTGKISFERGLMRKIEAAGHSPYHTRVFVYYNVRTGYCFGIENADIGYPVLPSYPAVHVATLAGRHTRRELVDIINFTCRLGGDHV